MPEAMQKLVVEAERVETLEAPIKDFHAYFDKDISNKAKAWAVFMHQFRKYYFVLPPAWRVAIRAISAKKRVAPDFTSTGAVRSGTSSISNYILQHPCIALPLSKELSTFVPKEAFIKAQFPLQQELENLKAKYGVAQTGNCYPVLPSISWIYWGKALNPDMKFIITLRNPVDRLFSHWRWNNMITSSIRTDPIFGEMPGFNESMRIEMQDLDKGGCGFHLFTGAGLSSFMRHSIYLPFIKVFHQTFGKEYLKIINADEFFLDPITQVKEIYDFLGLPEVEPVKVQEKNAAPPENLDPAMREELVAFYEPYNQALYDYLDRDMGWK